jgi:hypothetical protein
VTRASTLDLISLWMDSPTRRLDFALSVTLRGIAIDAIREGAERARQCYPRADQRIDDDRWVAADPTMLLEAKTRAELAEFLHRPLDPARECSVQQMVLARGSQLELVTKSHHAAADLMSALMFLRAQLEGAKGRAELSLRTHPSPARKSRFAQAGPSTQLWTRRAKPSGERRALHIGIETSSLRAAIAEMTGARAVQSGDEDRLPPVADHAGDARLTSEAPGASETQIVCETRTASGVRNTSADEHRGSPAPASSSPSIANVARGSSETDDRRPLDGDRTSVRSASDGPLPDDARSARDRGAAVQAAAGGFTFNDVLGAAALSALRRFQQGHGAETRDLSLWFPINVREDPWSGFGNGSSRIRIYGRHLNGPTIGDRARAFREQVAWSREHGEWAVPEQHPLLRLPVALRRAALRAYLRRPWVDMGTMLFSHVERLAPDGAALGCVQRIEIMSNLDLRHAVGLAAMTLGDRTQLSFTYDPALLDAADVEELASLYREELCAA